jgi:hypothetical protein
MTPDLLPGQILARGTCRHLLDHGFATVEELVPDRGLRVDVMALGPKGELWVIECKSGIADFRADRKWQGYLPFCDRFFWAVDAAFPVDLLPAETGLIIADGYDAEILRVGPESRLAPARRKLMMQKFARHAALRLQALRDPGVTAEGVSASVSAALSPVSDLFDLPPTPQAGQRD